MNFKKIARISFVATMILALVSTIASASPGWTGNTAYIGSLYMPIIRSPDATVAAAQTHDIDLTTVPRRGDIATIQGAGYTLEYMQRIGYTMMITNNRVWPLGTTYGSPTDPHYDQATAFRKALWRLVDKDAILPLYGPLFGKANFWLPPGQAKWIEQDPTSPNYAPLATTDRLAAKTLLDNAGFAATGSANPNYEGEPWASPNWRIDPLNPTQEIGFTILATNPTDGPVVYQMSLMIKSWWEKAGIHINLVPSTFNAMVALIQNADLYDYQMMYFGGIVWGTTAPDILYDFTNSGALPLWNTSGMNRTDLDAATTTMMTTLDNAKLTTAVHDIQNILADIEPYMPVLLWNQYRGFTGPWAGGGGYLGIVNAVGFGSDTSYDYFSKLLGRAGRSGDDLMKWVLGNDLDGLNPFFANTAIDWQSVLHVVTDGLYNLNSYNQKYEPLGADPDFMTFDSAVGYTPKIKAWVGPGRSQNDGDGTYNAPVTTALDPDTGRLELATYNGIPVDKVTTADLVGDDQLGMRTAWKLRDKMYWHDSDPGLDGILGTVDDGVTYQVTTADVEFVMNKILIGQQNQRYFSNWWFVNNYTAIDPLKFEVYEERQYLFAFESHGVGLLGPKHIFEPDLIGPDNIWGTADDINHRFWTGWQTDYMEDKISARNGMPGWRLSRLIGFGPYIYHISGPSGIGPGWQPGITTHVEPNVAWFGTVSPMGPSTGGGTPGRIKRGDIDLNQLVELPDLSKVIDAFGASPGTATWDPRADVVYPAQIVNLDDFNVVVAEFGQTWGPYRPYTIPP